MKSILLEKERHSRKAPATAALCAVLVLLLGVAVTGWQRSQNPPGELLVEVLPEEILEVEPPDWEALAAEMEAHRKNTMADTADDAATQKIPQVTTEIPPESPPLPQTPATEIETATETPTQGGLP